MQFQREYRRSGDGVSIKRNINGVYIYEYEFWTDFVYRIENEMAEAVKELNDLYHKASGPEYIHYGRWRCHDSSQNLVIEAYADFKNFPESANMFCAMLNKHGYYSM